MTTSRLRWIWAVALVCCGCGGAQVPVEPCPSPPPCPANPCQTADKASQEESSNPLILKGSPTIPAEVRRRMGRYLSARGAGIHDLADDGKSALIGTRFGQTSQIHRVARPLGARTQLTFIEEPVHSAVHVPGQGGRLTYMSDAGGGEAYQLFDLRLDSGKVTRLTDGKSRTGGYRWSKDGSKLAFTSNARNGKDMDIYVGDGGDPASHKRVAEVEGYWWVADFSPDNKRLLLGRYVSINDSRLHLLDLASGKMTRITPEKPVAAHSSARFDKTGKGVYLASDREGEFEELYRLDLAKKTFEPLSRGIPWNVEQLTLSPDGRTVAFTTNEDGFSVLYLLDTRSKKRRKARGMPAGIVHGLAYARKAPLLGLTLVGPTRNADVYTYDPRRGKVTRWTESELGGIDRKRLVTPTAITYPTFDGKKIPAHYYRPPGKGPFPVVVWIHGGPEAQSRPYFRGALQYMVAESGLAVLMPNVRGSAGYGKSYLLLDNGFKREDSVKDIGALLDWIKGQKELDGGRVGVFGGSYGGYMVLASLVHFADRIKAGVDIVGISNFVTFLTNTKAYRRDLRRAEYGDEREPKMKEFLTRISPTENLDKIKSALFVAHGANDPRVPLSETDQIVDAVKKGGQDVWYMVAKNEGHGFRKRVNRDTFYQLTVLFFEKYLK